MKKIYTKPKTCATCKEVYLRKSNIDTKQWNKSRFCSIRCKAIAQKEENRGRIHTKETRLKMSKSMTGLRHPNIQGDKHPNWKGGVSKIGMHIRKSFKYRQWRSDVFTRDDFTCVSCSERGKRLEADHYPKTFAEILSVNGIRDIEESYICEELWNINNGRTLCNACHRKTPTYGNNKYKYNV